jgi:hypothetical protein
MLSAIRIHGSTTVPIGTIAMLAMISITVITLRRFPSSALWIHRALRLLATWFFTLYFWALRIAALRFSRPNF